ncbi:hypothetical protein [Zarconia navalis]|nr:hypothetical protein [Zarconia navalis]
METSSISPVTGCQTFRTKAGKMGNTPISLRLGSNFDLRQQRPNLLSCQ